jgi:hypothetical protein
MAANFQFGTPYNYHPEFGYLHPSHRIRWQLRLAGIAAAVGFFFGATAVAALMRWPEKKVEWQGAEPTSHKLGDYTTEQDVQSSTYQEPAFAAAALTDRDNDGDGPARAATGKTDAPQESTKARTDNGARGRHLREANSSYLRRERRGRPEHSYFMPSIHQNFPQAAEFRGKRYSGGRRDWNW